MKDNTYLSRGITKEGKEVVGYYNTFDDKHYILEKNAVKQLFGTRDQFIHYFTEITSPPQKCLGIRDCEGELIFEGDRFVHKYIETICDRCEDGWGRTLPNCVEEPSRKEQKEDIFTVIFREESCDFWAERDSKWYPKPMGSFKTSEIKIIHPTNKEEIESRS